MLISALSFLVAVGYLHTHKRTGKSTQTTQAKVKPPITPNGLPQLNPLPAAKEVWECSVVVVGGSLGGVAAAAKAMQSGAKTCLIELTPWIGGQISSQGVSAVDESLAMRAKENYSKSWIDFKQLIKQQPVELPAWANTSSLKVADINSCWVGKLCFPPKAGASASEQLLQSSSRLAPGSRWGTSIAFKGAKFDSTGKQIVAIYAVKRIPRESNYTPKGRLSQELTSWYSWFNNEEFEKVPVRLQAPVGSRMIVIDATDTGELVGWAGIPHRLGSESRATTGEIHAAPQDNPKCTQAFTFPFVLALRDDGGLSRTQLAQIELGISKEEHRRDYSVKGFPFFAGRSFFNYRRIVSKTRNDPFVDHPVLGDMTMVNWNRGNDWNLINPPLILTSEELTASGQRQNWMGGVSLAALKEGENHALLFAEWLMETQNKPGYPLAYLFGSESLMGTTSGLSMVPYIREGRRILGRIAHGQSEFMMREADIRTDVSGGRDFSKTVVAVTHYDIDIHGCRDRNWKPANEATKAPAREFVVRPVKIPLESMIPQRVDNLLIGGKSIAVTHIVNAVTRVHNSEWSIGAAAGVTAAWLLTQPDLTPADIIPQQRMAQLQQTMRKQGLRLSW
nr:FAD-dependent oxidoreductase [Iningainema tapete]